MLESNGPADPANRWVRVTILIVGLVAPQAMMYAPSLAGRKVLLPLEILAEPAFYLPSTPEYIDPNPVDRDNQ